MRVQIYPMRDPIQHELVEYGSFGHHRVRHVNVMSFIFCFFMLVEYGLTIIQFLFLLVSTYIPLTCVWVSRWVTQILGLVSGVFAFFDTNMLVSFALGDAKVWRWGSKPTPVPNANGFASQWNIGLNLPVFLS